MQRFIRKSSMLWVSLLFFVLLFAFSSSAEIDVSSIMGLWLFEEGQETEDSSGNGLHGTLKNGAICTNGKYGKAVDLDGSDDYFEIPDGPSLDGMEEITVAAWVFLRSFNANGYNGLMDKTDRGGLRSYNIAQRSGQWEWGLSTAPDNKNVIATGSTKTDEWVHLTGTYDGEMMRLYENGIEIGRMAHTGPVNDSVTVLSIGRWNGNGGQDYADVLIDEVIVLDVALDENDIGTLMEGVAGVLAVKPNGKTVSKWGKIKALY